MIAQLRSELLKLRTTRTTFGLLLGMLALTLFIVLIQGLVSHVADLDHSHQRTMFDVGGVGTLFAALVGTMLMTSEFRHGTIRPTLLFSPRRGRVVSAKLGAGVLAGLAFGLIAEGVTFGAGYAALAGRGIDFLISWHDVLVLVAGTTAAAGLWGGIGVGIGTLVRSQVGAIIGLIAWLIVAEQLLFGLVPSVGRFGPGAAGQALAGGDSAHLLPPLAGGLVLAGYMVLLGVAGTVALTRRDVG